MNKKIKVKVKIMYKEIPATKKFLILEKVVHNALDASIYRFSNDGSHFKAEIVDSQKSSSEGCFVAT